MRITPKVAVGAVLCYGTGTYLGILYMRGSQYGAPSEHVCVTEAARKQKFSSRAAGFDKDVGFSEFTSRITSFRKRLLANSEGRILEVAAGTGRNLKFYPTQNADNLDLVLTDVCENMLEVAKPKVAALNARKNFNVEARVVDAERLPFADDSFDTVVDTFGLCSVENPSSMLAEVRRVCKPGGKVLLLEHGKSFYGYTWLNRYLDNRAHLHAESWGCWWNKNIVSLIEQSGLTIEEQRLHHFGTCYELVCTPGKQSSS